LVADDPESFGDLDGHCPADDACSNVKISVKVVAEPQMMQNAKLGPDTYFSGVAGSLDIKFTDNKSAPIAGMTVKESNTNSAGKMVENPNPVKTDSKGVIADVVGKGFTESTPTQTAASVQQGKEVLTSTPVNDPTTQTLTFTTTGADGQPCTCQATYSRTLTNIDSNGNLSTTNNSHGVNYTLTTTQPVVRPAPPRPAPPKREPQ
jgi:hypothetical protein